MRLSPPKQVTWWIALILIVIGILGELGTIATASGYAFWFAAAGGALMLIATMTKGL